MLYGTLYKRELTIQALKECDWREGDLSILDGRVETHIVADGKGINFSQ
jgi:hypothetical protein